MIKRDNYQIQAAQAKKYFLTYDQQELIHRCRIPFDENWLYVTFLSQPYRISRKTGDMQRNVDGGWIDGNSFHEVMTILDWLCDSRENRYLTGRWINLVSQGSAFHRQLQETPDSNAVLFDTDPAGFCEACEALGGKKMPEGDIGYVIPLIDDLAVYVQLWHGDEEFLPNLRLLWDENTTRYLRYETTWYAAALLWCRLQEYMGKQK